MTEIFKIRKIIQNTNKNYFMRYKMGVINLFFEINYFKHKISQCFDVIVAIETAVRGSF